MGLQSRAMPISSSDLSWWAWMLISVVALAVFIASSIGADLLEEKPSGWFCILLMYGSGIVAVFTGIVGIVRLATLGSQQH